MTLILTVANASGICQSSDYQLVNAVTGDPVSDRAGSKQLQASFKNIDLRLAFTGIAAVGAGSSCQRTIDWLSDELKELTPESNLQEICEALRRRSESITKPHGSRGVLEIVLSVGTLGEPFRTAVISNADWGKRPPKAKSKFRIVIYRIDKPFVLISGFRASVPVTDQHRLEALA
jgi:hypothetical protein